MNEYLRTDTAEDLVATLELATVFLLQSRTDERYCKWFIQALHSAVQSTAALALENGNGFLVQKPGTAQRMLEAHAKDIGAVEPNMDNFDRLIKKSLDKANVRGSAVPLEDHGHCVGLASLNKLRDGFVHFNVKSWSIEFALILDLARFSSSYIEHYTVLTSAILWHEESHQQRAYIAVEHLKTGILEQCIEYGVA